MLNTKRITLTFDMTDPVQREAYLYYKDMGHKKSEFLAQVANLSSAFYGPITPDMVKTIVQMMAKWGFGTGTGAISPPQALSAPASRQVEKKKAKKKKDNTITSDIKKSVPTSDKEEDPTKNEDKIEEGVATDPIEVPAANQDTEDDDDDYMIAPGMGIWDPVKLKESQKGMTMADIFK